MPPRENTLAIWNTTPFEDHLECSLKENLGDELASEYLARYVQARTALLDAVLPQIPGTEPNLTDHGPEHIRNVLTNVTDLLQSAPNYFRPIELYVLGLGVLFHDVGNLDGRHEHNRRIAKYYDFVRSGPEFAHEKSLVVQIAKAHSGKTESGSRNTLADVPIDGHLDGTPVRAREIAAVVRFADELAEGPQRTSQYLQSVNGYSADSTLYHRYSSATQICIDAGNERIAVTYQLQVKPDDDFETELSNLEALLEFVYQRLAKMDLERKYARFHCVEPLLPFRQISVALDVQLDGEFLDLGLETNLSDDVDLDKPVELLSHSHPRWAVQEVLKQVRDQRVRRSASIEKGREAGK
ncbi:MAG: hypothetical protein OXK79_01895 [Chloroflexota bacterium]|nr:hypothetical protein [Chloroflexota bacterium]